MCANRQEYEANFARKLQKLSTVTTFPAGKPSARLQQYVSIAADWKWSSSASFGIASAVSKRQINYGQARASSTPWGRAGAQGMHLSSGVRGAVILFGC